jgi:ribose/xylose/arabinose/galactoside ABC-type transport system permease subunit
VFFAVMAIVMIGSLYEPTPAGVLASPDLPRIVTSLKSVSPALALCYLSVVELVDLISREMASYYLLPALGMLIALRRGAIDLSVWAVGGFGGLIAAQLINAGVPPLGALIVAGVVGAGVGLVNGTLTARARIPSFIATLAVGAALVGVMRLGWPGGGVRIPEYAFGNWLVLPNMKLVTASMLLVGVIYAAVMVAMMVGGRSLSRQYDLSQLAKLKIALGAGVGVSLLAAASVSPGFGGGTAYGRGAALGYTLREAWAWFAGFAAVIAALVRVALSPVAANRLSRPGPSLVLAMCVSGALCAIGGVVALMDQGVAPVIKWPIDDLRIPFAAIIAGGAFWAGAGRGLLAGACLPTALLMAVVWWENGPQFTLGGYELQMVLLGVMVVVTQMAIARATSSRFGDAYCRVAAVLTALGTVAAGAAVYYPISVHHGLVAVTAGVGVWLVGMIIMMIARTRGTRPKAVG